MCDGTSTGVLEVRADDEECMLMGGRAIEWSL